MAYRKRSDRKRVGAAGAAQAIPEPSMPPVSAQKKGPSKRAEQIKGEAPRSHLGKRSRSALSSAHAATGPEGTEPRLLARGGGIHIKKSHEGLLHRQMGIAKDKPISTAALEKEKAHAGAAEKKRIVFAENARHFHHGG